MAMMKIGREFKDLLKEMEEQGFTVHGLSSSGHWKVWKDGHLITTMPKTPGDRRGVKNFISTLRRAGFKRSMK